VNAPTSAKTDEKAINRAIFWGDMPDNMVVLSCKKTLD